MSDERSCPVCGSPVPAEAPGGACPKCLLGLGLAESARATAPYASSPGQPFLAPAPEEIAGHFPQLEILELLGQGGMGAVYKARQPGLDRLVAVKILPPEISRSPGFAERFAREARALARLNHPHIVAVYDSGERDGLFYFVMEYVDGTNLREMMRAGHLEPQQALAIVPQICDALQFAHENGVVHRDIKPENILVDKAGRVKIADFGLAKLASAGESGDAPPTLTGTLQVMGTPRYMAPEQLAGSRRVDHRADIYSLGVVFYELLTGELPLGRFDPPSRKVRIDVRLDEVVLRTLENSPDRRYQRASEIRTDLESIEREPQEAPPPTADEREAAVAEGAGRLPTAEAKVAAPVKPKVAPPRSREALAAETLQWPGVGLIVSGLFTLLLSVGLTMGAFQWVIPPSEQAYGPNRDPGPQAWTAFASERLQRVSPFRTLEHVLQQDSPGELDRVNGYSMRDSWSPRIVFFAAACYVVLAVVQIFGGIMMRRGQAYAFCLVASGSAILSAWMGALPLPLGLWALVVLLRRDVRELFASGVDARAVLQEHDKPLAAVDPHDKASFAGDWQPPSPEAAEAAATLQWPAVGLMFSGVWTVAISFAVGAAAFYFVVVAPTVLPSRDSPGRLLGTIQLIGACCYLLLGSLQIVAGVMMRRGHVYALCRIASLSAVTSLWAFPFGVAPFVPGLWALVVLLRTDVRELFASGVDAGEILRLQKPDRPTGLLYRVFLAPDSPGGLFVRLLRSNPFAVFCCAIGAASWLLPWGSTIFSLPDGTIASSHYGQHGWEFWTASAVAFGYLLLMLFVIATAGMRHLDIWRPPIVAGVAITIMGLCFSFPLVDLVLLRIGATGSTIIEISGSGENSAGRYAALGVAVALLICAALQFRKTMSSR